MTKRKQIATISGLITLLIGLFLNRSTYFLKTSQTIPSPNISYITATSSATLSKVLRVIDGDTIQLENGKTVRYIGIDTPELHHPKKPVQCFGKEAMEINKKLIEGKTVRLEKDVSETDRYGRLLRFVYLDDKNSTPSSIFINDYLIRNGYAHLDTFPPDVRFADIFRAAEKEARDNNRGLWKTCPL